MGLMGIVSKLSSVICHFSPVVSISLSSNNMVLCWNSMALPVDNMPLSGDKNLLQILTKKVAEMFGSLKNISYLCNIEIKAGTGHPM